MAWYGSAQVELDNVVQLQVCIRRYGVPVAEGMKEIDTHHTGTQMKLDILQDQKLTIPRDMRNDARNCQIFLSLNGRRKRVDDYDRLSQFGDVLHGANVVLEIFEAGVQIQDDDGQYLLEDFHVRPRGVQESTVE